MADPNRHGKEPFVTFPRAVILVAIIGGLFLLYGVIDYTHRLGRVEDQVAEARGQRDALIKQVEGLGAKPVVSAPPGERGPAGAPGIQGPVGPRGPAGGKGPRGPRGIQGEKGDTGDAGATGQTGEAGSTGEQGVSGQQGDTGPTGPPIASFTFTQGGHTWTCTDPDGDLAYSCESDQGPDVQPTPEPTP